MNPEQVEDRETWIALGRGTVIWIPSADFLAYLSDRPHPDCAIAYDYPVFERLSLWRWFRVLGLKAIPILVDLLLGTGITRRFVCPRHPGPAESLDCHFRPATPIEARYNAGRNDLRDAGA